MWLLKVSRRRPPWLRMLFSSNAQDEKSTIANRDMPSLEGFFSTKVMRLARPSPTFKTYTSTKASFKLDIPTKPPTV